MVYIMKRKIMVVKNSTILLCQGRGMNEVLFRISNKKDQKFLWQALYYAITVPPGAPSPDPEIVKLPELACYVKNWMNRPGDLGFVATENGRHIGAAWIRIWSESEYGYGYIKATIPELSISLLPEYRGKGIGTRLLELLLNDVSKEYEAVSLSVASYSPAIRLYIRNNFRIIKKTHEDSFTMIRYFKNPETSRANH